MRAFRVRTVVFGSLFVMLTLSWMTYVIVHFIEFKSIELGTTDGGPSRIGIWMAATVGLLSLAVVFGYGFRRWIIQPLEAMSRAARQIAAGDLDISLPPSGVREITEVRDGFDIMVASLRDSIKQQADLEEERRFFIGAIAHDLRTPLFALKGYLEGLERNIVTSPEQRDHYVKVCKQKSHQLELLIADLLAYTKTEYLVSSHLEDSIVVPDILQRSVDSLRHLAESKKISIQYEVPEIPSLAGNIYGDANLLERAFNNLLDNAVRYTPRQGVINVECSTTVEHVTVTIRDTGPGISENDLERVFEPLYRGESSRNRESGGTGLGLTIARRIFRAHGGDLTVGNHPHGGALVTGWIPKMQ